MNPFQNSYEHRLREWKSLRILIRTKKLEEAAVMVDNWWQQAPLVNHHLHPQDQGNWPDPWTILSDNIYCTLTRGVGICYTLLMSDIHGVNLVRAVDSDCIEHNLVVVGNAKYILNYYPGTVLSTTLDNFDVVGELPLTCLHENIK